MLSVAHLTEGSACSSPLSSTEPRTASPTDAMKPDSIDHGTPKKTTPRVIKSLGLLCVITTVALGILAQSESSLIERLPQALRSRGSREVDTTCVVYERPPRTGSSTIGMSLKSCLQRKGYDPGDGPWMKYHSVIPFMLTRQSQKIAIVTRHFVLPFQQLRSLLGHCSHMLWISSTRDMRSRLASKAKFDVRGKHGSSELARHDESEVLQNLEDIEAEELYEKYPYVHDEKMLGIVPDYIVRHDFIEEDLGLLLEALGCPSKHKSLNVHVLNGTTAMDQAIQNMNLKYGDKRHQLMTVLAEHVNDRGLVTATQF